MNKLTLQELELLNTASAYNGAQHNEICGRATLELIEYKRIEKELGTDLLTLARMCSKETIYVVDELYGVCEAAVVNPKYPKFQVRLIRSEGKEFPRPNMYRSFEYNEKGVKWALTKEELKED